MTGIADREPVTPDRDLLVIPDRDVVIPDTVTALLRRQAASRLRGAPAGRSCLRLAPAVVATGYLVGILLVTGTPAFGIAGYAGYAALAVVLPGTLVFRSLRSRPHTLVEDLAMGAVVGLVLELAAWAGLTAVGQQRALMLWPLLVVAPFLAVPRLRRHWWVRGYQPAPVGWSLSVAAVVAGFTTYLAESFLWRNPILPRGEGQRQYVDLAFQLSLAGETKHGFPHLPQVATEPLHYHWFGFAHLGAASTISGVDLPTVFFRLAVPALCALAIVLIAVVGWRISGRPYVGAVAAVLMFAVGEFTFENGVRQLFGTQTTFIIWSSPSMTYSWVLLIPLIAVTADRIGRASESTVPGIGRGAWPLLAGLLLASTGAKASSVPVMLGGLVFTGLILLVLRWRQAWPVLAAAALALAAQAFATAVLFAFEDHGVTVKPFYGLTGYLPKPQHGVAPSGWIVAGVILAFVLNLHLRWAGIPALLWHRRGRLEPVQLFLLGGALAGPAIYLVVAHPGNSNQYFLRTAFTFGVILSAWGYVTVLEGARLRAPGRIGLAVFAVALVAAMVAVQLRFSVTMLTARWPFGWIDFDLPRHAPLLPLLRWAGVLAGFGLVAGILWALFGRCVSYGWRRLRGVGSGGRPLLRGRGGAVLLTGILIAGAPGLVMDAAAARSSPNGGAYGTVVIPASRVDAARWVRDHSAPTDVLATNVHCVAVIYGACDARSFWLSAYAERSVLVEGWSFAPRAISVYPPFWDQELLHLNDEAFTAPSTSTIGTLAQRYRVRWLVVDRAVGEEAATLRRFADLRYDTGRIAVYQLR